MISSCRPPELVGLPELLVGHRRAEPSWERADVRERESHPAVGCPQDPPHGRDSSQPIRGLGEVEVREDGLELCLIVRAEGCRCCVSSFVSICRA
jgi:hypothetical protein